MIEQILKDITLELLNETKAGEYLAKARVIWEKIQEISLASMADDNTEATKAIKIGTIAVFSILNKIVCQGKDIRNFSAEDWKEIAIEVTDKAVLMDGTHYSVLIFNTYAKYIEVSVETCLEDVPEDRKAAILAIADETRALSDAMLQGRIDEIDYTERCLWLQLEAMIKLLYCYSAKYVDENTGILIEGISSFAFEYARYSLYRQEHELLTLYLEHQYEVDAELQQNLDNYKAQLRQKQEEFNLLLSDAFSPDISNRLQSSVALARTAGVAEDDILQSIEQIDDFFG